MFRQGACVAYDPDQTFNPVVHKDPLLYFLLGCAAGNFKVYHAGVKAALLRDSMYKKIFVKLFLGKIR